MEQLLTVEQVAEALNITENTVRRYAKNGDFVRTVRIGNRWRIPESSVSEFLERWTMAQPAAD